MIDNNIFVKHTYDILVTILLKFQRYLCIFYEINLIDNEKLN